MKKIFYILLLSIIATQISCDDAIDIQQPGLLTPDAAFNNISDFRNGLIGVYNQFDLLSEIRFNAVYSDELGFSNTNGGQNQVEMAFVLTPTSGLPAGIWSKYSITLNRVNKLIDAIQSFTPKASDQAELDDILGQTLALRAFAHFQMQTYFTTDYTDDNALGFMAIDFTPATTDILPRNTNGEVFNLINQDLNRALNLIQADSNTFFVSKDFVIALKARMALYREDYTTALTNANLLLAKYPISNRTQFFQMFDDTDNTECIFKFDRTIGDTYDNQTNHVGYIFAFSTATINGGSYMDMGRALYNTFNSDDVRLSRYIDPSSLIDPNYSTSTNYIDSDVLVIRKYPGSDNQPLMNDLKVFRSAEMLLIKAECLASQNNFNQVATLLKQLQDARHTTPQALLSITTQQEAFGFILDERRKELAFEGHRWVDLKRLGLKGNRGIDRDVKDCERLPVCSIPLTDHRFTMPVPLLEMGANTALVQNPGY